MKRLQKSFLNQYKVYFDADTGYNRTKLSPHTNNIRTYVRLFQGLVSVIIKLTLTTTSS